MYKVATIVHTEVVSLRASVHVRYFEDGEVNGHRDIAGIMPMLQGETWCITINLETGTIEGWPKGTRASVHYKVCDEGTYELLDRCGNVVAKKEGYVPPIMYPGGQGYGDYVIMSIDASGRIADWKVDLEPWEP